MLVLGIETSCDETGIALYHAKRGLLTHCLHSQIATHAEYGGVVPELASRDHIRKLIPLIRQSMAEVNVTADDINGIAYTAGPGLIGALLVGAAVGRSLAWTWNIPALAVHHMEGHLLAPMLEPDPPTFPFVALLVSGGHTQLIAVTELGRYELLGESLDDAAGEAFDKSAKMMGLDYPGGPALSRLAQQGDPNRFQFPRPMVDRQGMNFSFSGLKTHTMVTLQTTAGTQQDKADVARAFEDAVADTLTIMCRRALQATGLKRLVVAGGVSANRAIREKLNDLAIQTESRVFFARHEFCTDNGAMIAYAGCMRLLAGQQEPPTIMARARWPLTELEPA